MFRGVSLRKLSVDNAPPGMLTRNLCRNNISHFKSHLYCIPSNGKKNYLWEDRIMNIAPLKSHDEIRDLRCWLLDVRYHKLFEITEWDHKGNWQDWSFQIIPGHLLPQLAALKSLLSNIVPNHRDSPDSWGWGDTDTYITTVGYITL